MKQSAHFETLKDPYGFGECLRISIKQEDGKFLVAKPIEFTELEQGERIPVAMKVNRHDLQVIMNSLWRSGFRPDNGEGNVGQLAATEKHLEDMRNIAFSKLEVEQPGGRK